MLKHMLSENVKILICYSDVLINEYVHRIENTDFKDTGYKTLDKEKLLLLVASDNIDCNQVYQAIWKA